MASRTIASSKPAANGVLASGVSTPKSGVWIALRTLLGATTLGGARVAASIACCVSASVAAREMAATAVIRTKSFGSARSFVIFERFASTESVPQTASPRIAPSRIRGASLARSVTSRSAIPFSPAWNRLPNSSATSRRIFGLKISSRSKSSSVLRLFQGVPALASSQGSLNCAWALVRSCFSSRSFSQRLLSGSLPVMSVCRRATAWWSTSVVVASTSSPYLPVGE